MNLFVNIWNKIKSFFSLKNENLIDENKDFTIRNSSSTTNMTKKKFQITNERNVPVEGKFTIVNKSRPLRCGQCGTEKSYTKTGFSWECKVCKYKIKA